jgi:chromosome segregation ATPase
MSDLIEMLRSTNDEIDIAAADEIERLRSKCNQRRDDLKQARDILDERYAEIERLTAENAEYLRNGSEMLSEIEWLQARYDMAVAGARYAEAEIGRLWSAITDAYEPGCNCPTCALFTLEC